jgi:hypothetical protein
VITTARIARRLYANPSRRETTGRDQLEEHGWTDEDLERPS